MLLLLLGITVDTAIIIERFLFHFKVFSVECAYYVRTEISSYAIVVVYSTDSVAPLKAI